MNDYKKIVDAENLCEDARDIANFYCQNLSAALRKARKNENTDRVILLTKEITEAVIISRSLADVEIQKMVVTEYPDKIKELLVKGQI